LEWTGIALASNTFAVLILRDKLAHHLGSREDCGYQHKRKQTSSNVKVISTRPCFRKPIHGDMAATETVSNDLMNTVSLALTFQAERHSGTEHHRVIEAAT
jgi:hypothetical protein